jgi:hypothetical protein
MSLRNDKHKEIAMTDTSNDQASVVVVGGGYGGINAAKALDAVADVTLVDPTEAFFHNVAGWRTLVEPEWLDRIFLPYEHLLARGRFVRDRAVAVDGRRVTLASGDVLEPDYLVLATGSSYPFPAKTEEPDIASARSRLRAAHEALLGAKRALIVGAGPAGLELAGEIKAFYPDKHVTIADVAPDILTGPYDQELRDELRRQLDALGVELRLGAALSELPTAPPATLTPIAIPTADGDELVAARQRVAGADVLSDLVDGFEPILRRGTPGGPVDRRRILLLLATREHQHGRDDRGHRDPKQHAEQKLEARLVRRSRSLFGLGLVVLVLGNDPG